ncbi:oxidoreductase [Mycolicibacterium porcinum]|uniref:FAD-dependent oxidoreductase n=1 Tax=Mycolicibacterium porcinum TaxID=39693 RepID=A0AAW5T5M8_9MYCO|nr:FAD-dependent oxidoreductase [Mycolicibacterium porcinum]MCV7390710.1 FAD-dependent oxidoreductase [Mycolicibacterium porcinum]ORB37887.1 NADH:flavin oxidoreductase [Mycolicibacterium porcinum]CDO29384.1 NADPH dependent 2,4-dienoyl-CoA reductase FadH [Mycolicibacterium vulneris]
MRDPRYDILFEPVQIGPVTARNRFYQVPHCNGMGYRDPSGEAYMRRIKAEGGWAVVCTEQVEIHPTSDIGPFIELRLWDDQDLPAVARIAEKIHEGGALAGIELAHNGLNSPNLISRETPLGPQNLPVVSWNYDPVQAREMTKADIADMRYWHREAVRRSLQAEYDIIYVYAGHAIGGLHHFLSRRYNNRTDEYGGSIENRARLLREILEDTREMCAGKAAVACRISVDELLGDEGITRAEIEDVIGMLGEHPDLWDFVLGSWEDDSVTSRFGPEAEQEPYVRGLKALTTKPVVGVGRFTSPDMMVHQVKSGVLDLIGAARPSIADPFLPSKIETGHLEDIRECIGCNICVSGDFTMSPIRCTQNPTMGEEFRRGWHPEKIRARSSDSSVLVVGAGPAGLEAARSLGNRGYRVSLAEATRTLGGRVARESKLPSLSAWIRVVDYREAQLAKLDNVDVFMQSEMTADDIIENDFNHVVVATGASWRHDGVGRFHTKPLEIAEGADILSPDDIMAGTRPRGRRVVVFDDDHYYLGGVIAELLAKEGLEVTLVTPAAHVSQWTTNTLEVARIRKRVIRAGVDVRTNTAVTAVTADGVTTACVYTGDESALSADSVVMVTARLPHDGLYQDLLARRGDWAQKGRVDLLSVRAIGDAWAPATIAAAVWSGHRYAEELDEPQPVGPVPYLRETAEIALESPGTRGFLPITPVEPANV